MNVKNTSLRDGSMLIENHKGGCVLYEKRDQVEAPRKGEDGGTGC